MVETGQLIRTAEKLIAGGKYQNALDQLFIAQQRDPNNIYIEAIIARTKNLQTQKTPESSPAERPKPEPAKQKHRYLSVTVGSEFMGGIKAGGDEPRLPSGELQSRVRFLIKAAENFLQQGSYGNAFESLMKAYLLDPGNPYVIACEKMVLPMWELARKHGATLDVQEYASNEVQVS
jgi:hypothetical protein